MTDTDTVERVASAMWESRGNASTWDDAENTALVSIYRNLARAAIAALPPAVPATTPDPAESHVDGWRVRVIEWATDETVKVVQCKGEREAKKIERGMGINMASEYYTEIDNKPRTTTTTTTPDLVSEAAKVLLSAYDKEPLPDTAAQAAHKEIDWCRNSQNTHFLEHPTQTEPAGTSCREDFHDAFRAALRALTKDGEAG